MLLSILSSGDVPYHSPYAYQMGYEDPSGEGHNVEDDVGQ
jgi:hypothetical protein